MTSRKAIRSQGVDGLSAYLEKQRNLIEKALAKAVPAASVRPATIHAAMRYSLLAGGKRLRPILTLAAAEACGIKDPTNALPAACAVELIHTYSLIHDDLPCMDDDDLRRGRPTSHKVYGEGVAVLAGDALLTQAFALVGRIKPPKRYQLAVLLEETATAAGSLQLIAGQVADLEAEGRKLSTADVRFIHERKTGAMIVLSLRVGAMMANATPEQMKAVTQFGRALGLAFQIIDDILDVTQSSEQLGKSAGKDLKCSKATYPAVIGIEASRKEANRLTKKALSSLKALGSKADRLAQIADQLMRRSS
jgi:geranylgeranyl diphosphate synthase type II